MSHCLAARGSSSTVTGCGRSTGKARAHVSQGMLQGLVARGQAAAGDPVHLADARIAVEPQLYQRAVAAGRGAGRRAQDAAQRGLQAGGMGGVAQAWLPRTRRPRVRHQGERVLAGIADRQGRPGQQPAQRISRRISAVQGGRLPTLGQTAVDQHGHAAGPAIGDQRLAQRLGRYGKRDQDGRRFRPREDGRPAQGQRQAGAARAQAQAGETDRHRHERIEEWTGIASAAQPRRPLRHRKAAMLGAVSDAIVTSRHERRGPPSYTRHPKRRTCPYTGFTRSWRA